VGSGLRGDIGSASMQVQDRVDCSVSAYRTEADGRDAASEAMMDPRGFDSWTRSLSTQASRRGVLRRLGGAGALVAMLRHRERPASAHHCTSEGCGCTSGTHHACGSGLVCCASGSGSPGGAGVCTRHGQCGSGCRSHGAACPGSCNWGEGCSGCCTGFCGHRGKCDSPPNLNATCTSGKKQPCRYGLTCCPYVRGLPGGAGTCEYRC
jgi:hypothetical protein